MANSFGNLSSAEAWRILVETAIAAAGTEGYLLRRLPGRGRSNLYEVEHAGRKGRAAIRTTRDREIAFSPYAEGWRTLEDVQLVFVAAVDRPDAPANIEVYKFPAPEVRARFDEALGARLEAGHRIVEDFGMWVSIDPDDRGLPASAGTGIAEAFPPIAVVPIDAKLLAQAAPAKAGGRGAEADAAPPPARRRRGGRSGTGGGETGGGATIAAILEKARGDIAALSGVAPDKVTLDLKIEY